MRRSKRDRDGAPSLPAAPATAADLVALGDIVNTHALRGEVRVRLYNPASTTLQPGCTVVLRRGAALDPRAVVGVRPHKRCALLQLEGCDSMSAAEALVGCEVCVPAAALPAVDDDEIYCHELEGMTVVTTAGEALGSVDEVVPTGSNEVCVVRGAGREHLIPLIADVVKEIDRVGRRLVIEPLPGLLEPAD